MVSKAGVVIDAADEYDLMGDIYYVCAPLHFSHVRLLRDILAISR